MSYHNMDYLRSGKLLIGGVRGLTNADGSTIPGGWRPPAWWFDGLLEDKTNPTHFSDFIPMALVKDKLFGWDALESVKLEATFEVPERDEDGNIKLDDTGNAVVRQIVLPAKAFKAIGRSDWVLNGVPDDEQIGAEAILSIQADSWGVHQLRQTFIENLAKIMGGEDKIGITSAMILKWGRVAAMEISINEEMHNDTAGFDFRPNLVASTSFDGSMSTSYTRTTTASVCDNTLQWALQQAGDTGKFVLRHTKNSASKLQEAAQVLGILSQEAEKMDAVFTEFAKTEITEEQFVKWMDAMVPVPDVKVSEVTVTSIQGETIQAQKISTNAQTIALNKREKMIDMWDNDPRVAPWKNTKLGLMQLNNTFNHHEASTKGAKAHGSAIGARVENNMMKVLKGGAGSFAAADEKAIATIDSILAEVPGNVLVAAGGVPEAPEDTAPAKKAAPRKAAAKKADNN